MIIVENKTKYITLSLAILAIFIVAAFVYQQIAISDLKKRIGDSAGNVKKIREAAKNNPATVKGVEKSIVNNVKEFKGTIISKNGDMLSVEAELIDFSKLSGLTEEELHQDIESFPKTKKKLEVSVGDSTQLISVNLENLLAGTKVLVESNDFVYKNEKLSAAKITALGQTETTADEVSTAGMPIEDQIKQAKFISGPLKEVGDNYLVMGAAQIDISKVTDFKTIDARTAPLIHKDYKVFFNDKTQFPGKKLREFQIGVDVIRAFSSAPVYSVNEFTATKIEKAL